MTSRAAKQARVATRGGHLLVVVSAVLALAFGLLAAPGAATSAIGSSAAPEAPARARVPQPGRVVFLEDFENVPAGATRAYQDGSGGRTAYVSASPGYSGFRYTGAPGWINGVRCNGVILSAGSATAPAWATTGNANAPQYACGLDDGVQSWSFVRLLALASGQQFGGDTDNFVYTSFSECNHTTTGGGTCTTVAAGATDGVLWQTVQPIPLPAPNRYVTFGVDTAAICAGASPRYQFAYRVPGASTWTTLGTAVDACSSNQNANTQHVTRTYSLTPAATGGITWSAFQGQSRTVALNRMSSNQAVQLAGGLLEVKMYNTTTATEGNDGAFDNVRALDVTPTLDKQFSPPVVTDGQASTLRFTVTNTDELDAKSGWSFSDQLPAGLRATGTSSTTCLGRSGAAGTSASVTADAGSSRVVVEGSLGQGQSSCVVDVDVRAWDDGTGTGVGVYVNGPGNFQPGPGTPACWDGRLYGLCGLEAPGEATLTVTPVVDIAIEKHVDTARYTAGQELTYTVAVSNAASSPDRPVSTAKGVVISDAVPARVTNPTWTCVGTGGATCGSASGTGDVADTATIPPGGVVTYTVTGQVATTDWALAEITNIARAVPPEEMPFPSTPDGSAPEVPFAVVDPGCPPGVGCEDSVTTPRAELTVVKSADPPPGTPLAKATTVTYTLEFRPAGPGPVAVTYVDDLRGVLDDATFGAVVEDGGLQVDGPRDDVLRITGTVESTVRVRYTVTVKESGRGDDLLRNLVVEGGDPPGPDAACVPGSCTEHPVRYLYVEKTGGGVPLGGAQFVLLADVDGRPGPELGSPALTAEPGRTGLFATGGLDAGAYWLQETRAPDGYSLLAEAVRFEVGADGTVTRSDPAQAPVVSVGPAPDGASTITVSDQAALALPLTGGRSHLAPWLPGVALLAVAAGLAVVRRRARVATLAPPRTPGP
jgi:uncharacterized repeat protein (TIGR01451 family)